MHRPRSRTAGVVATRHVTGSLRVQGVREEHVADILGGQHTARACRGIEPAAPDHAGGRVCRVSEPGRVLLCGHCHSGLAGEDLVGVVGEGGTASASLVAGDGAGWGVTWSGISWRSSPSDKQTDRQTITLRGLLSVESVSGQLAKSSWLLWLSIELFTL